MNPNKNHIRMCKWEIALQILRQVNKLQDKSTNPNKKAHQRKLLWWIHARLKVKWHPYQSLYPTLKDNFHLHYLPCLLSKWKWWINRHFAPIQKLKRRCTILFLQKTFKLPRQRSTKHKTSHNSKTYPAHFIWPSNTRLWDVTHFVHEP